MASGTLPAPYLSAGQEYLEALAALGLTPAFLGWGWDAAEEQWYLVLVTSIVDAGGPLALERLLFRAYNAKATPQQISPFRVRVFSPEAIPEALFWLKNPVRVETNNTGVKVRTATKFMGLELEPSNSYQTPGAKKKWRASFHDRRREWERFKRKVEALAA